MAATYRNTMFAAIYAMLLGACDLRLTEEVPVCTIAVQIEAESREALRRRMRDYSAANGYEFGWSNRRSELGESIQFELRGRDASVVAGNIVNNAALAEDGRPDFSSTYDPERFAVSFYIGYGVSDRSRVDVLIDDTKAIMMSTPGVETNGQCDS
ncbi:MAG: hypothetical protein K2P58_03030 [Hyphomonadaceae bacterium]|nr:hypothetical protein [Hyphomonadaceae bacterium]